MAAPEVSDCCDCGKSFDVAGMQTKQRRVLKIVLAINIVTFGMMLGAACYTRSSSLLSGGLDNLGDALTYALSLAVVSSGRKAKARVSMLKGALILCAAIAVGAQILWRLRNPTVPIFEGIGAAGLVNLGANWLCLHLLTPYRTGDINLASAWECARNDIYEGIAVVVTALLVWIFGAGWPDLVVAAALLLMFLRSAMRVVGASMQE